MSVVSFSKSGQGNVFSEPPENVLSIVFSTMTVAEVGKCGLVSRRWQSILTNIEYDQTLWRPLAKVLGKRVWTESVGKVGAEPFYTIDGKPVLWRDVCRMHKAPSMFDDRTIEKSEVDFLVPATIKGESTTINHVLKVFASARIPIGCRFRISPKILKKYGDIPIKESYWVRHTWSIVKGTRNLEAQARAQMIAERGKGLYRLPMVIEELIFHFLALQAGLKSGCRKEPLTYTQCIEFIQEDNGNYPVYVGSFEDPTPDDTGGINCSCNCYVREPDGAAAVRSF
jgi:hypothetical protein